MCIKNRKKNLPSMLKLEGEGVKVGGKGKRDLGEGKWEERDVGEGWEWGCNNGYSV